MNHSDPIVSASVAAVQNTSIVPTILEIICRTTGMGFAAVARVTSERWIGCEIRDEINFGLRVGGELKVDTTICHEIRQSGKAVIIDHVAEDEFYCAHHTPAMYGFQSYISVPVKLGDGSFFGTLCAIDPNPAILNTPEIRNLFKAYAALIAFHIDAVAMMPKEAFTMLKNRTVMALRAQLITITGLSMEQHSSKETAVNYAPDTTRKRNLELENALHQSANTINELLRSLKAEV